MRARSLLLPLLLAGASAATLQEASKTNDDIELRIDAAARDTPQAGGCEGLVLSAYLDGRPAFGRPAFGRAWGSAVATDASVREGGG